MTIGTGANLFLSLGLACHDYKNLRDLLMDVGRGIPYTSIIPYSCQVGALIHMQVFFSYENSHLGNSTPGFFYYDPNYFLECFVTT